MGTFVRRLVALTVIWLFATTALTYAAARRMGTTPAKPAAATTTTVAAPKTLVVPDVRNQAYVFAEGTLGDAGFAWRVTGSVRGYAANTVASQTPAPGTRVFDTGSPTIVLRLTRAGKESGVPTDRSPAAGTPIRLADLSLGTAPAPAVATPKQQAVAPKKKTPVKRTPVKKAPSKKWPQNRPSAFTVPGARKEPLDEMPLTDRADQLLRFLAKHPKPTDANVRYWLYQHAWIVAGARMGWWHGSEALQALLQADRQVWNLWGIGARSAQVARNALAEVDARSS